jgi:hypothetical protein
MPYDLDLLSDYCRELGFKARRKDASALEVSLTDHAVLCFLNASREEDSLMGFADTSWHTHGNLIFCGSGGEYVELDPLNLLSGLSAGEVLICELETEGKVRDRWLIHHQHNDEFKHLQPGERPVVLRARCAPTL